ncbi:hypothetical protein HN51_035149, partial [Arachis hypogaea]
MRAILCVLFRNASLAVGMCSQGQWEKVSKEFFAYRVVLLILGITLISLASFLSKSLAFYYSSAMAVGVILMILMILYQ